MVYQKFVLYLHIQKTHSYKPIKCKLCYNIRVKQIRNELTGAIEIGKEKSELLKKYISTGSTVKELYIGL